MEIPSELIEQFEAAYPHRGAKQSLTLAAIKHVLKTRPIALNLLFVSTTDDNLSKG